MLPTREPALARIIPFHVYADLLGESFEAVGRCWGLAVEVFRRFGLHVAGDGTDVFDPVHEPKAGDLVVMQAEGSTDPHAGVYLGDGRVLHTTRDKAASVAVARLAALQKVGLVKGFYRHAGIHAAPTVTAEDCGQVIVVYLPDILKPIEREITRLPWREGMRIGEVFPAEANVAVYGGKIILLAELVDKPLQPGSTIVFGRFPGDPGTLISLGVGLVLSFLATLFAPALPSPEPSDPGSPTFDLAGLRNTSLVGIAQPLLYGEHRVGGNFIHGFQKSSDGKSILYLMMFVSRGPIQSIAGLTADADELTGDAIPDDIQIDGSPAKNYGAAVSVRLGGSDQTAMPGFNEITTATSYTQTLSPATPFTHVTAQEVDAFDLILNFPLGLYNINVSGGGSIESRSVGFTLRRRVTGTTTWTTTTHVIVGARRGAFTKQITVRNLTRAKYDIQIERFAAGAALPLGWVNNPNSPAWPEPDTDKESRSDLINVNEIVADALFYPGKALLGIRIVATDQLSGALPTITVKAKGLKVWVWDGVSETSPAFGTAKVYSDNPAWCVLDMLINPNHGLKRNARLTLNHIGLSELKTWADNCDTLVSDGRGGTTKRATCDIIIDEVKSGWEFISALALSHWARLFIAGNEIRAVTEKIASPVALLNMGNLRDVSFGYKGKRHRPNVVEVSYFNEETNYESDVVLWPKGGTIASGDPIIKESVQAIGVTRACHAYRLAHWRWNLHNLVTRTFEGTTGPENIHLVPGDVAEVQHEAPQSGLGQTSGRVLAATASTVTLDHDLTITSGTNKIAVRTHGTGADVIQERTLTNGTYTRGTAITVTANWDVGDTPTIGCPYHAGPVATFYRPYRLMAIETTPANLERRLQGMEYSDALYSDDPGDVETFTDTLPDPRQLPGPVSNLRLTETHLIATDGGVQDFIRVEFVRSAVWDGADVWYRLRNADSEAPADWVLACRAQGEVAQIGPFAKNQYVEVAVTPVSKQGSRPLPELSTKSGLHVNGPRRKPDAPLGVTAELILDTMNLFITPPADTRDIAGYQVRYGSTWGGSVLLGRCVPCEWSFPLPFVDNQTIRVRSISRSGVVSGTELTAVVEFNNPTSVYTLTDTQAEGPGWAGAKVNTVVDGSNNLILDGSNLTGTYDIPTITPSSGVSRTMIDVYAGLLPVERLGTECAFRATDPESQQFGNGFYLTGFEVGDFLQGDDLTGIPADGLIGVILRGTGLPIDVIGALTPGLQWNAGGPKIDFHGIERAMGNLDFTVTLNRPHDRYEPYLDDTPGLETNLYGF